MTTKYHISNLFKDGKTRLVVPNVSIAVTNYITTIAASYFEHPDQTPQNFFTRKTENIDFDDVMSIAKSFITSLIDSLTIGLGVTKIETTQNYVMPFSKGIGSTGEIIHLLGAENELINIVFKTDKYPGRLGYVIKRILQKILEDALVVYVVDDLFLSTPCLIRKMKISKEASYRGAVMGEIELVSLATGSSFVSDKIQESSKVRQLVTKLKFGLKSVSSLSLPKVAASVGAITIGAGLISNIVGVGSS